MTTISKSFTGVGVSAELLVRKNDSITYSVSGTFVGTAVLESSNDGGATWVQVASATAAASGTVLCEPRGDKHLVYRFRCSAYTSGTIVTSITDATANVREFFDDAGNVVLRLTESGIEVPGTLTLTGALATAAMPTTSQGVGAKNGATVSVVERGDGVVHQTVLTCTATPITIADDAGVAQYGGVKVYDFPEGLILTLGAVIDGALTLPEPFIDTYDGDVALGSATATTGATLTGTEADILQSTPISQAVAKVADCDAVSAATALTESGARHLDGTATAKDVFLNFVIDDNAAHTAETGLFTGTITITWINLGDK